MRSIWRCLAVTALLAAAGVLTGAAAADKSIRCSSYSFPACNDYECCRINCVYCEQVETGEILSENCRVTSCWTIVV